MPYKKIYYPFTCPKCNKEYTVLPQAYFRKIKDEKYGKLCTSCRAKVQWEEMSDEDKNNLKVKAIEANKKKYNSLTEEQKQELTEKRIEGIKRHWSEMTEEEKAEESRKRSQRKLESLSKMDDKRKKEIGEKISKTKLEKSSNMTEEEREERKKKKQSERKIYWNSLPQYKKDKIIKILKENNDKFVKNMTEEEREKRSKIMTERNKEFWSNSEDENVKNRKNKARDNLNLFRMSLTDIEKKDLTKKRLSSTGINNFHNKFERAFKESILENDYYLTNEEVLSNSDVIHSWDYGIYSKSTNELVMVVDLDGAYFHADKCDYDGLHSKEEYDESRILSISNNNIKHFIIQELNFSKCFELMLKTILMNYDEYVDNMFKMCRSIPFPTPKYNNKELYKSFNDLYNIKTEDKYHESLSLNTRNGDRLIQHFHESIYMANRKGKISPYDAWYDDKLLRECIQNRIIYQNHLNPNKILQGFNISKVAPKVSVFSAGRAKILINRYLYDCNEVFDPFSGFSGRMLGTISLGKKYIGQDISLIHTNESNTMIKFLKENIKWFNVDNIDASVIENNILQSSGQYECLFTCPPYSDKEQWLEVPVDNRTCDDWIDECLNRFNCKKYLFVVDHTDRYVDYIVDIIKNKSHFGLNQEYIILIEK